MRTDRIIPLFVFILSSFLNASTPFDLNEHDCEWKLPSLTPWGFDKYQDFNVRDMLVLFQEGTDLPARSITPATHLVYSQGFGMMMALSSPYRPMGVWSRTLINTATRKLSVSIQTGNVNYPSLRPYRIVFVNGNLKLWLSSRFSLAWPFKPLI